jgi:hypothetical protein
MPTPVLPVITQLGLNAALAASGNGLSLAITHAVLSPNAFTPGLGSTISDIREVSAIQSGARVDDQITMTFNWRAEDYAGAAYGVGSIGFYAGDPLAGGILFATVSAPGRSSPQRGPGVVANYTHTYALKLSGVPSGSVTVTTDPMATVAMAALSAHLAATDPHPGYLRRAGGTMLGPLVLAASSAAPLHPVARQEFDGTIAAEGSYSLPGGLVLKWGTYADDIFGFPTAETQQTITFPAAFPTACFVVLVTVRNPTLDGLADTQLSLASKSAADFTVSTQWPGGTGNQVVHGFNWLAIGN